MTETTRKSNDSEHSNQTNESGASDEWSAGLALVDRVGEFRELDQHGSRFEVMEQCHAWEGQDHE